MSSFLSAGPFRYREAWAFLGVLFVPGLYSSIYFCERYPDLVRRRLQMQKKMKEQKVIITAAYLMFFRLSSASAAD